MHTHMNQYFVLFRVPVETMEEWMKATPEAERKAQADKMMQDWPAWTEKNKAAIIDQGKPLGKTKRVTKDGTLDTRNDLNYYMIVQAASHEEAAKLLADNPHLQIPTSFVDVMEIPHAGM